MDTITLGQIALGITFIVGLITGIAFLHNKLKEWLQDILKDQFSQIKTEIGGLSKKNRGCRYEYLQEFPCKNIIGYRKRATNVGNGIRAILGAIRTLHYNRRKLLH